MSDLKKNFDHTKNKGAGKVKEAVGKVTGNEQMELKGKLQSNKADAKKKWDAGNMMESIKENAAEKINKEMDRKKKIKKKNKKNKKKGI